MSQTERRGKIEIPFSPKQAQELGESLDRYDAPEMFWDDESSRGEGFRHECSKEIKRRLNRVLRRNGLSGGNATFDEDEYRVAIESLTQDDQRGEELINHMQYFKKGQ